MRCSLDRTSPLLRASYIVLREAGMADKMTSFLDAAWMPSGRLAEKCQHFREGRPNPKAGSWEPEVPEQPEFVLIRLR